MRTTDYKKAFVDTAPFIYFIEKNENNPQYYDKVKKFFSNGYEADKKFVTSVITMEEYFVFPYRNKLYSFILYLPFLPPNQALNHEVHNKPSLENRPVLYLLPLRLEYHNTTDNKHKIHQSNQA